MEVLLIAALALALVALLAVAVVAGLLVRDRAAQRRALASAYAETEQLRDRLDSLTDHLAQTSADLVETREAYLITDAGREVEEAVAVSDRLVLNAAVGEPLLKAAAWGYGVRHALAPATRHRIWFEVKREVRRARRQRRRDTRQAYREWRAADRDPGRAADDVAASAA